MHPVGSNGGKDEGEEGKERIGAVEGWQGHRALTQNEEGRVAARLSMEWNKYGEDGLMCA